MNNPSTLRSSLVLAIVFSATALGAASPDTVPHAGAQPGAAARSLAPGSSPQAIPAWFEPAPAPATFVARRGDSVMTLDARGASVAIAEKATDLRLSFVGGRPAVPVAERPFPGMSHYFIGNDPAAWRRDVPHYGAVRYREVYPHTDVVFYGDGSTLEYDIVVGPGADPGAIKLAWSAGSSLRLDEDGNLVAHEDGGAVMQRRPVAFQEIDGVRRPVQAAFELTGNTIGFRVGAYDPARPLVIDPIVVVFGTFLGGADAEFVETAAGATTAGVASDAAGNLFVAGDSASTSVVPGGTPTALTTPNVFVVKLNSAGSQVLFATYIGGSKSDVRGSLALDGSGNILVAGQTKSTDFPVTAGAIKTVLAPTDASDAFLVRLNPSGVPTYSTYLGGSAGDSAEAIATFGTRAIVVGSTASTDLTVTANAAQGTAGGGFDGFVLAVDPSLGTPLVYGSYLGGSLLDAAFSVATDTSGRIVVSGQTRSLDFPTSAGAFDTTRGGSADAFVTRIATSGAIDYSTYFGGTAASDVENAKVAVDAAGRIYLAGLTTSTDLPAGTTPSPFQGVNAGSTDAFVAKLWPEAPAPAQQLVYRTYLGGSGGDAALAITLDAAGRAYLAGFTTSDDFPLASPLNATRAGAEDGFIARLSADGTALEFSTYIGGTQTDYILALDLTTSYGIFALGLTSSAAPVPLHSAGGGPAIDDTLGGTRDAFVVRLNVDEPVIGPSVASIWPAAGLTTGGTRVTITGSDFVFGASLTIGGAAAADVIVKDENTILAITPPGAVGPRDVVVTNPSGLSGTLAGGFTYRVFLDNDGDGMDDNWEIDNGLDPNDPSDANGDPDDDGVTNLQEYLDGTDPRSAERTYFAEGATIQIFATRFAVMNYDATRNAVATFEFLLSDGTTVTTRRTLPPGTSVTVDAEADVPGMTDVEFSTVVKSNIPIAADRTMTWAGADVYGAHAERSIEKPAATWYLAEGATIAGFNLFYLIQNPNAADATVTVRYLLSTGAPVETTYVAPARSRFNIWVNLETVQGVSLDDRQLSAVVTTDASTPIIVERAMYQDAQGLLFGAGHESAGVTAPSTNWILAEGATGPFFDLFVLVANPNAAVANVTARYLLPGGATLTRSYPVAANSRFNIWVDLEPGLTDTAVSTVITSDIPIIVERAMWWAGAVGSWYEAHNSPGATKAGHKWVLAEGESGAFGELDTYVLIANTSDQNGTARVTVVFEDGSAPLLQDVSVAANSRSNVWIGPDLGGTSVVGKRYAVLVESLGTTPAELVVERAMYWSQPGVPWAAGTNAIATRIY
jgi:hypothetical protein